MSAEVYVANPIDRNGEKLRKGSRVQLPSGRTAVILGLRRIEHIEVDMRYEDTKEEVSMRPAHLIKLEVEK